MKVVRRFKMPIKLIKNYQLKNNEYIIAASDNKDAKHYEIFYKGKKLNDVTAVVRIKLEGIKNGK